VENEFCVRWSNNGVVAGGAKETILPNFSLLDCFWSRDFFNGTKFGVGNLEFGSKIGIFSNLSFSVGNLQLPVYVGILQLFASSLLFNPQRRRLATEKWAVKRFGAAIPKVHYSESPLFPLTLTPTLTLTLTDLNPKPKSNPSIVARICTMDFQNSGPSEQWAGHCSSTVA